MKPIIAFIIMMAIFRTASGAEKKSYVDATYVTDIDYSACHYDCAPFDVVQFYFCFDTGDRILIGHKSALKWEYDPSEMHRLRGQQVKVRYDKSYVWVIRTDGKEMKLKQEYTRSDLFSGGKCGEAVKQHLEKH